MVSAPVISLSQRWLGHIQPRRRDVSGIRAIASIAPATEDGQDRTQGFRKRQELDSPTSTSNAVVGTERPRLSVSTAKPVAIFYN
jgi:hypothetical protein